MKALVLAGGKGLKMYPLSQGYPKVLLRVAGKPVIDYSISGLIDSGITDLTVVVSDDRVEEHIVRKWGMYASVVYQEGESLESAMQAASSYFSDVENFILAYGDIVAPKSFYKLLIDTFISSGTSSILSTVPVVNIEDYGVAIVKENKVVAVYHKPQRMSKASSYALAGAYILPKAIFDYLEEDLVLPEALSLLVKKYESAVSHWTGYWVDIGYPWDIIAANYYVLGELKESVISSKAHVSSTAVIEGPVIIEEGAFIDHNAVIKGPVYIGKNAFVGMNTFIRKYTSIEESAVVGAFCEIKRSSFQKEASAGSYSLIVDSVLGVKSIVEPRVTILSSLPEKKHILRELPLQGIIKKKRKLGVFLGSKARIKAGVVVQPYTLIDADTTFP
ncbi:MAG: NTP transferase domain-containing protein [Thermoproteales archaeon]|nr:NTP transferase domain-containing protein [Thermoproteales archaeon]